MAKAEKKSVVMNDGTKQRKRGNSERNTIIKRETKESGEKKPMKQTNGEN